MIRSVEDSSMRDLTIAAEFISAITSESGKRQKQLTKDTGYCFTHTCKAMVELARYHLDQDHEYVPLGKASTDPLEKEFGKLRQGSGGTYFITVQQILEKVSINKTKLLLTLKGINVQNVPFYQQTKYAMFLTNCMIWKNPWIMTPSQH